MDEEDEIIDEIPIYLSKTLTDSCYVFQYPHKRQPFNRENGYVVKSCIKPMNEEVKLDFALETASKHYDAFKGEQFAIAADGNPLNETVDRPSFRDGRMNRQSFTSTRPMDNVKKYLIGIMQDKEMHAVPLKGILQMRPNFSYFDKSDKRKKAEQKAENEADLEVEDEAKQVTVKFARNENEKIRKAREKSFTFISKRSADEPWCEAMWYETDSTEAELERRKLFSNSNDVTGHSFSLTNEKYIESLVPPERAEKSIEVLLPSKIISKSKLKTLSLSEQLITILKDAKVITFNHIMNLLTDKQLDEEKVLRTLQTVGLTIRGNWIIQSELLYPPETVSAINGVPSALMCRARDYILFTLMRNDTIDRRKITTIVQIPPDEVKEILESIAMITSTGWKIQLPADVDFEDKYPEIKQRQDVDWKGREAGFLQMEMEKTVKRSRKRSTRESIGSSSKI